MPQSFVQQPSLQNAPQVPQQQNSPLSFKARLHTRLLLGVVCLVAHWHGLLSDVMASLTELCATETSAVATLGQLLVLALVTSMWYSSHMISFVGTFISWTWLT